MNSSYSLGRSCLAWAAFTLLNLSVLADDLTLLDRQRFPEESFAGNPPAELPEVYIWATAPETLEPSSNTRVSPGEFTITRIGDTNDSLILFVEFTGTAAFGQDYQEVSQYLVMPAGERKLTVLVGPLDDSAVEGDETVIATLSTNPPINSLPNYRVHSRLNRATVVIHDNDFPNDLPVVSISGLSGTPEFCPPNADCAGISFSLRRTGPGLERPLTVFIRYRGTAMADVDYVALRAPVTFEAGRDLVGVSSNPIDDTLYEGDETIIAEILPLVDYYVDPNRWQATTIIHDNDPPAPPVVSLELVDRDAAETLPFQNAIFWAGFRVLRTGPATEELLVFLNTQQGSARLGEDYRLEGVNDGSTVRFPAGAHAVNVRLYPIDDDFYEGDETVSFHLIAPPSGSDPYEIEFAHSSVSMVIHDNDPVTTRLEITSPRDGQHFQAGDVIELRAQIIGPGRSNELWSVEFFDGDQRIGTTRPGAAIWWQDAIGGQHVINARAYNPAGIPGQDTLVARPVTISVGPGPALPVVSIFASGWKTGEPCPVCLVAPGVFTVSRTGPTSESLNVYLEYDGPATPGQDYHPLPHQVTIPAGTNLAHVLLLALDDQLVEGPEIVRASLVSPEVATLGYIVSSYASEAMVVIGDDEVGAPELRLDIADPEEGAQFAGGTTIQISALGVWTQGEVDRPVEFFAGDRFIGWSDPPQFLRPTIPCLPSVHTISWTNPPPGRHELTARFVQIPSLAVTSPPVNITVGPARPVVRIEATQRIAEESSFPLRRLALRGEFTISRIGPTNDSVGVFVHYSGTATPGVDYPYLGFGVAIPAGATSTRIEIVPIDDDIPEGIETVVAMLSNCPPPTDPPMGIPCHLDFQIDQVHDRATVFIREDSITQASLAITHPTNGARFNVGGTIPIEAIAIDLEGYISRVEFWDGEQRIGVSEIVFIRPPDPGTPIYHSFEWRGAAPGPHVLTARATGADGTVLMSQPVHITVGPVVDRLVLEIEATDPLATEAGENGRPDPAVFTIRRVAGPRNLDVTVFYSVDGTAQNGVDYSELSGRALLPNGAESARLVVNPVPDRAREGDETVIIRLEQPVCIAIFPPPPECYDIGPNGAARAVIRDSEPNQPPHVAITRPVSGTEFPPDTALEIVAETRDPDGYVRKVEFFADGRKIGESSVEFIRPPDPGQPQTFTFVWRQPTPGRHALIARATDDAGDMATSAPVEIKVAMSEPLPIVMVTARDPFAVEPRSNSDLNTATFRIRRFGPTNDALVVAYSLHGTAENGTDYEMLSGLATIPAGRRSVTVIVRPLADDLREGSETVLIRLEQPPPPSPEIRVINPYRVGQPGVAVALINDGPWSLSLDRAQCLALPGGLLHICFAAEKGRNFRVETSSDFRNWETLFDTVSSDGTWHFIDRGMENHPHRFYRLTPEPVVEVEEADKVVGHEQSFHSGVGRSP